MIQFLKLWCLMMRTKMQWLKPLLLTQMNMLCLFLALCSGAPTGSAANRNCAAQHANGEWLLLTDDDCLPQPNWIPGFVAGFLRILSLWFLKAAPLPIVRSALLPRSRQSISMVGSCGRVIWLLTKTFFMTSVVLKNHFLLPPWKTLNFEFD